MMFLFTTVCFADTNWNVQSIDEFGDGNHPDIYSLNKVTVEGIILNDSLYMLDATPNEDAPFGPGAIWQIYIQGEGSDHGGTAVWMGQCYNNLPGGSGTYTDGEWLSELYRLSHDPASGYAFAPGDRVRVTGLLKPHNGKTNITERHDTDPDNDIEIELLEVAVGLPVPKVISLYMVKDANDGFIFDYTRVGGCELYQGRLVRVNDVNIVSGIWGPDKALVIRDGEGLTFDIQLGLGQGFTRYVMPTGPIDVIGIFDQESLSDYKAGYRILVPNYDGNGKVLTDRRPKPENIAGDVNNDGIVDFRDFAEMADDWLKCAPGSGGCN